MQGLGDWRNEDGRTFGAYTDVKCLKREDGEAAEILYFLIYLAKS